MLRTDDEGSGVGLRPRGPGLDGVHAPITVCRGMTTFESQLNTLSPQEKRALADWLWQSAENAPDLSPLQTEQLNSRADAALSDPTKRFPLGDAEKKLRR